MVPGTHDGGMAEDIPVEHDPPARRARKGPSLPIPAEQLEQRWRSISGVPGDDPASEEVLAPSLGGTGSPVALRAREFARTHLRVIVIVLLAALLLTGSRVLGARSQEFPPLVETTPGPTPAPASVTASAARLRVHVLGAVQHPGVVELGPGARVEDAIAAAGGLRPDADPAELNLAALLADADQVVIGTSQQPAGERRTATAAAASGGTSIINLNTATQAQLEELPGVGPVTATRIIEWRLAHPPGFSRVQELQEIDGIGAKTYAQIAPHVRV